MNSRLPVTPPPANAWLAELQLGFAARDGRTLLRENRHCGPLRVQKALYPEGDAVCQAIVLHPPSGVAGGDRLAIAIAVGRDAHAQITTPGAGKWYRSGGADAAQTVALDVGAGATLEWLPQESIVFDGARARMETRIDLAADARLIAWDILCLGRTASGERFRRGRVDLALRIDRGGIPVWRERGGFAGDDALLDSPAGWAGATVCGTLLATFPGLPQQAPALLERCRAIPPADGARHALSALPNGGGLVVARYLGDSSEAARHWFAALWHELRPACCGRPAQIPRIWNT
ncbi:urease accessory protein UreD [Azospira restricta]|uniref:Urease accessory protein UreD n=1 Tax=Azospira restricta TaxID=404405 RepID=A0A974PXW7_9RHOO|nr:urease accessory protein UreD [Azospira restricta]QRJ63361.1 urease accessory protein UreD [Azospira restricta]